MEVMFKFNPAFVDQEERSRSVEAFRRHEKDVLVATDVASKGLDFPGVQHVINYDMPDDVENYGINKRNFRLPTKLIGLLQFTE